METGSEPVRSGLPFSNTGLVRSGLGYQFFNTGPVRFRPDRTGDRCPPLDGRGTWANRVNIRGVRSPGYWEVCSSAPDMSKTTKCRYEMQHRQGLCCVRKAHVVVLMSQRYEKYCGQRISHKSNGSQHDRSK